MAESSEPKNEFLGKIIERKRRELAEARRRLPPMELINQAMKAPKPRGFLKALEGAPAPRIIAEIKRKSPSKGDINPDLDPVQVARLYESGGAAAISVLTDGHGFGGSLEDLLLVRKSVSLPLLRKDFIIDPYQVWEARLFGADAVLLITTVLSTPDLVDMMGMATEIGLDALVEVHSEVELERAIEVEAPLIGINNRNLRTFLLDPQVAIRLKPRIPENITVVVESGIKGRQDIEMYIEHGLKAFLIGETLMKAKDIKATLREWTMGSGL